MGGRVQQFWKSLALLEQLPWFRDVSMEMLAANKMNLRTVAAGWHEGESDVGESGSRERKGKEKKYEAILVRGPPADPRVTEREVTM